MSAVFMSFDAKLYQPVEKPVKTNSRCFCGQREKTCFRHTWYGVGLKNIYIFVVENHIGSAVSFAAKSLVGRFCVRFSLLGQILINTGGANFPGYACSIFCMKIKKIMFFIRYDFNNRKNLRLIIADNGACKFNTFDICFDKDRVAKSKSGINGVFK